VSFSEEGCAYLFRCQEVSRQASHRYLKVLGIIDDPAPGKIFPPECCHLPVNALTRISFRQLDPVGSSWPHANRARISIAPEEGKSAGFSAADHPEVLLQGGETP
jgi:hypothetical protein